MKTYKVKEIIGWVIIAIFTSPITVPILVLGWPFPAVFLLLDWLFDGDTDMTGIVVICAVIPTIAWWFFIPTLWTLLTVKG